MIRHNPKGNIVLVVFLILLAGHLAHLLQKSQVRIHGKQGIHILDDHSKPL